RGPEPTAAKRRPRECRNGRPGWPAPWAAGIAANRPRTYSVRQEPEAPMRITAKGQVTIPKEIREKAGLLPDTEVEFGIEGGAVTIRRTRMRHPGDRDSKLVRHLRSFRDKVTMSTDEVMALTRDE